MQTLSSHCSNDHLPFSRSFPRFAFLPSAVLQSLLILEYLNHRSFAQLVCCLWPTMSSLFPFLCTLITGFQCAWPARGHFLTEAPIGLANAHTQTERGEDTFCCVCSLPGRPALLFTSALPKTGLVFVNLICDAPSDAPKGKRKSDASSVCRVRARGSLTTRQFQVTRLEWDRASAPLT